MSVELKPCPFCGGRAEFVGGDYGDGHTGYWIECRACGTSDPLPNISFSKEEVAAAWNTRAERTCRMLHGRPYYDMGEEGYTCSECGSWVNLDWVAHYCPNCGAKVVEE